MRRCALWAGSAWCSSRGCRAPARACSSISSRTSPARPAVLRHRNVEIVALDTILPTEKLSVYDFAIAPLDLAPSEAEAEQSIGEVERRYAGPAALEGEIARWWEV